MLPGLRCSRSASHCARAPRSAPCPGLRAGARGTRASQSGAPGAFGVAPRTPRGRPPHRRREESGRARCSRTATAVAFFGQDTDVQRRRVALGCGGDERVAVRRGPARSAAERVTTLRSAVRRRPRSRHRWTPRRPPSESAEERRTLPLCSIVEKPAKPRSRQRTSRNSAIGSRFLPPTLTPRRNTHVGGHDAFAVRPARQVERLVQLLQDLRAIRSPPALSKWTPSGARTSTLSPDRFLRYCAYPPPGPANTVDVDEGRRGCGAAHLFPDDGVDRSKRCVCPASRVTGRPSQTTTRPPG